MIDIGINFTDKAFHNDLPQALEDAKHAGVSHMIVTGTHAACSQQAFELTQTYSKILFSTAGVHPHYASQWDEQVKDQIATLLANDQVIAVGETGLDFNRDFSPRPAQEQAFKEQLMLASEVQKPLFLHERDAFERQHAILKEFRDNICGGVQHCFTGNKQALTAYLDLDLYIGITGWVCDERRGQELQSLIKHIPNDRLLIETDGPYLLPRDLKPKPKSRRNEPKYLPHIAAKIAQLKGVPVQTFIEQTVKNTEACFGLSVS